MEAKRTPNSWLSLWLLTLSVGVLVALLAACGTATPTATPTQAAAAEILLAPTPQVSAISEVTPTEPTPTATPEGKRPQYGGTLNISPAVPGTLDPHNLISQNDGLVFYNGLVQQKLPWNPSKGMEYEPYLATEYSQSEDGTKWTFKLRQGVTWHDGEVFNADDVVATVQRLLDTQFLILPVQVLWRKVFVGVKKVDDYTVVLDTGSEPNSTAFSTFTNHLFVMVPDHLIRGEDPTSTNVDKRWRIINPDKSAGPNMTGNFGVGTGPFKIVSWKANVEIVGERNPNYFKIDQYGNRLPYVDRYVGTVYDPIRKLAAFVAGNLEYTAGIGPGIHPDRARELCAQTRRGSGCYHITMPQGYWAQVLNHQSTEPFKNAKVVQAARYSQDMDAIYRASYGGELGFLWMNRFRYPDSALSLKEQYEFLPWSNPARRAEFVQKAKDLVVEAGYPDGVDLPYPMYGSSQRPGTTPSFCTGSTLDQAARQVDSLYRVGIRVFYECRQGVDAGNAMRSGLFSISSPGNPPSMDPGGAIDQWALPDSPAAGGRPWKWEGQLELNALYRKTVRTVDPVRRNGLWREMERYMANPNLTMLAVGYASGVWSIHGCVHNYHPGGNFFSANFALESVWLEPNSKCREG